jgi:hypothetical protein
LVNHEQKGRPIHQENQENSERFCLNPKSISSVPAFLIQKNPCPSVLIRSKGNLNVDGDDDRNLPFQQTTALLEKLPAQNGVHLG